jgi:hypothetical protein
MLAANKITVIKNRSKFQADEKKMKIIFIIFAKDQKLRL